jgi:hypothetical protein
LATAGTADAELVKRAGARDEAAVRSIMQANNRRLYRIARGILRNDSEAEDVVQEPTFGLLRTSRVSAATPVLRPGWRALPSTRLWGDCADSGRASI